MEFRVFTREELRYFDGRDGRPAYIGFEEKVYDLSTSYFWQNGNHFVAHQAGNDLTVDLKKAPHGKEWLDRFPIVGMLRS